MLLGLLTFISSCGTSTVATDSCAWIKVITVSRQDVLTDETARQLLQHNLKVEEICAR